jgi:hypothetical protein
VQVREPIPVASDAEIRDRPYHHAQEIDDGADVLKDRAQLCFAKVKNSEAGCLGQTARSLRASAIAAGLGAKEELGELPVCAGADLLRQVRPTRPNDSRDLDSAAKGSGASSATSTTVTASGASRRLASSTLGGHDSVAARVRGRALARCRTSANTSPPPVRMSRTASAVAIRAVSMGA